MSAAESELELERQIEALSTKLQGLRAKRAASILERRKTQILKRKCGHSPLRDFKVSEHVWKCSICGRESSWGPTWASFGCLSCRKCGDEPAIEAVVCSSACMDHFERERPK